MEPFLVVIAGLLFSAGLYMLLRRSLFKLVLGIALLGQAINLFIFAGGRLVRGVPPIIPDNSAALQPPHADPVPHALILTAIVIGFGILAFTLVLIKRLHTTNNAIDIDTMTSTEQL